jgi:hypothetical protein
VRKLFLRHRRLIAIETVDGDHAAVLPIDARPDAMRKLAGRKFGGVHLLEKEPLLGPHGVQIDVERLGAGGEKPELFVENEQRRAFTAADRRGNILQDQQRLAGPCRADDQRARARHDTTT